MDKRTVRLLRIGFVLACLTFAVWALVKMGNTPSVEKGRSVVLCDAEDYARSNGITENADATSEYIFLNHGQSGIISVFDWSGAYCFSIVTTSRGNGAPELFCCGDTLWVIDKNKHVFVYDGPTLTQDFQIESPVNGTLDSELRESSNHLITLSDNKVYGPDGKEIMTVAGITRSRLSPTGSVVVVAAFVLVALAFIRICVKDVRKSASPPQTPGRY